MFNYILCGEYNCSWGDSKIFRFEDCSEELPQRLKRLRVACIFCCRSQIGSRRAVFHVRERKKMLKCFVFKTGSIHQLAVSLANRQLPDIIKKPCKI